MTFAFHHHPLSLCSRSGDLHRAPQIVTASPAIAARISEQRIGRPRLRMPSLDALDYVLFLPGIWLACSLGMSLRLIGPLFVVVPVGFCLLYASLKRVVPPRLLSVYVALCLLDGFLSKYQLFPTSWQVHFMTEAIVRQLIPLLGFFSVAWASKAYFRDRLLNGDTFIGAPLFIILAVMVAPAVMFQQHVGYEGDYSIYAVLALLGAFINNAVIACFFITAAIFFCRGWRRYVGLGVIFAFAVFTHFIQFRIFALITFAILLGVPARRLLIGVAASLLVVYSVGFHFIPELMRKEPNEGLRLALVADALSSAVDTYGIGIGYGRESVRWAYQYPNMPVFKFLPDAQSMTRDRMLEALSNGVENSFAQSLLRTGVVGFSLLSAAIFAAFPSSNLPRNVRNFAACLFAMLMLGLFVNSALESPLAVVGHAFVYGYLLALRARARLRVSSRPRATGAGIPLRSLPSRILPQPGM